MSLAISFAKKLAFTVAMFVTVGLNSSFASDSTNSHLTDDSNSTIKASFHKDFHKAELLAFEPAKNYNKLTFKMNDIILFAFYSDKGELLAVSRNITSDKLPLQLMLDLKKDYTNYWITELFEINIDETNTYYVTVETADVRITLRSNGADNWEVFNKTTKQ